VQLKFVTLSKRSEPKGNAFAFAVNLQINNYQIPQFAYSGYNE